MVEKNANEIMIMKNMVMRVENENPVCSSWDIASRVDVYYRRGRYDRNHCLK